MIRNLKEYESFSVNIKNDDSIHPEFRASRLGPAWLSEARAIPDQANCAHDALVWENMCPNCAYAARHV